MGPGGLGTRSYPGASPTSHIPHNSTLASHLDCGALGETEVVITMLCLPGVGALGVADDDRLVETGIEVECQV